MPFIARPAGRAGSLLLGGLLTCSAAAAQQKPLTLDDIYDPDRKVDFGGAPATGLAWISDTRFLWPKGPGPVELRQGRGPHRHEPPSSTRRASSGRWSPTASRRSRRGRRSALVHV